jgi:hypothetical protein
LFGWVERHGRFVHGAMLGNVSIPLDFSSLSLVIVLMLAGSGDGAAVVRPLSTGRLPARSLDRIGRRRSMTCRWSPATPTTAQVR